MTTHLTITVRYAETDQMGIVHHSVYAVWFEAARTDFIQHTGISYAEMERRGLLLPLYEITSCFKSPARYGDDVVVETRVKSMSRVRLTMAYTVRRAGTDELIATGETLHAFTDASLRPLNAERAAPDIYALMQSAVG